MRGQMWSPGRPSTARREDRVRRDIAVWIDTWYNRKRLHSTNNMTSPIDYELANAA